MAAAVIPRFGKGNLPKLIVIGAQKAGTTWLFENFRSHSGINVPFKEINYLNIRGGNESVRANRILDFCKLIQDEISRNQINLHQVYRFANFALHPTCDVEWYISLYSLLPDVPGADISPAYSVVDAEQVAHLKAIVPDARILFIIRNPLDRILSAFRMQVRLGQAVDSPEGFAAFAATANCTGMTDYETTLTRWRQHFGDAVTVMSYDRLCSDPRGFLNDALALIDVAPNEAETASTLHGRSNVSPPIALTREAARPIAAGFLPMLERLEGSVAPDVAADIRAWRDDIRAGS